MGLADDIAAFLDEDPFGECGGPKRVRASATTTRREKPPNPAASPVSQQPQIVRDTLEVFGGRILEIDRRGRQGGGGQRPVLRARPAAEGVSALADDPACATRRNDVMDEKPFRLYRQALSRWGVASGGCKPEVK
jgi:hypothetical protein